MVSTIVRGFLLGIGLAFGLFLAQHLLAKLF
jgi:hypothetical protein